MGGAGAKPHPGGPRWEVRRFASIDSTNRYLLDEARRGAPEGLVAMADYQEAGRGRLGRRWVAAPGSALLMSVLLRPKLATAELQLCTAAVSMAAADACGLVCAVMPDLKWPNDLVLGERKLGGVLSEALLGADAPEALVVGLGLNLSWPEGPPPGLEARAVALAEVCPAPPSAEELLGALLAGLGQRYARLSEPAGRAQQASEYRRRCITLGHQVQVHTAEGSFIGLACDLTPEGNLVVDHAGCRRTVGAGDVIHLRPLS